MVKEIREFVTLLGKRFRTRPELRDIRLRVIIIVLCSYDEPLSHACITELLSTTDKTSRRLRSILVDTGYATESFNNREIMLSPTQKARDLVIEK